MQIVTCEYIHIYFKFNFTICIFQEQEPDRATPATLRTALREIGLVDIASTVFGDEKSWNLWFKIVLEASKKKTVGNAFHIIHWQDLKTEFILL